MAQHYSVTSQNRSVRVLGPTEVIDTEEVGITTHPHSVYVEYPLPLELWQTRAGFTLLDQLAQGIEQQFSEGLAVGGSYVQDYDVNNLLVDYCEFVVQYTPGDGRPPQRTTVLVPLEAFIAAGGDPFAFNLIDPNTGQPASPAGMLSAAYDTLVATANA